MLKWQLPGCWKFYLLCSAWLLPGFDTFHTPPYFLGKAATVLYDAPEASFLKLLTISGGPNSLLGQAQAVYPYICSDYPEHQKNAKLSPSIILRVAVSPETIDITLNSPRPASAKGASMPPSKKEKRRMAKALRCTGDASHILTRCSSLPSAKDTADDSLISLTASAQHGVTQSNGNDTEVGKPSTARRSLSETFASLAARQPPAVSKKVYAFIHIATLRPTASFPLLLSGGGSDPFIDSNVRTGTDSTLKSIASLEEHARQTDSQTWQRGCPKTGEWLDDSPSVSYPRIDSNEKPTLLPTSTTDTSEEEVQPTPKRRLAEDLRREHELRDSAKETHLQTSQTGCPKTGENLDESPSASHPRIDSTDEFPFLPTSKTNTPQTGLGSTSSWPSGSDDPDQQVVPRRETSGTTTSRTIGLHDVQSGIDPFESLDGCREPQSDSCSRSSQLGGSASGSRRKNLSRGKPHSLAIDLSSFASFKAAAIKPIQKRADVPVRKTPPLISTQVPEAASNADARQVTSRPYSPPVETPPPDSVVVLEAAIDVNEETASRGHGSPSLSLRKSPVSVRVQEVATDVDSRPVTSSPHWQSLRPLPPDAARVSEAATTIHEDTTRKSRDSPPLCPETPPISLLIQEVAINVDASAVPGGPDTPPRRAFSTSTSLSSVSAAPSQSTTLVESPRIRDMPSTGTGQSMFSALTAGMWSRSPPGHDPDPSHWYNLTLEGRCQWIVYEPHLEHCRMKSHPTWTQDARGPQITQLGSCPKPIHAGQEISQWRGYDLHIRLMSEKHTILMSQYTQRFYGRDLDAARDIPRLRKSGEARPTAAVLERLASHEIVLPRWLLGRS